MNVLAIETSAQVGSVALMRGGILKEERFFEKGLRHGRELVPAIDSIVASQQLQPKDLSLIAVSLGPGSYTGIRVGVTCAKALAYALQKPLAGVPSLDVVAGNAPRPAAHVIVMQDAKRRRFYFCTYRREGGRLLPELDYAVVSFEEALAAVKPGSYVIGDGIPHAVDALRERGAQIASENLWLPRASAVARLGAEKFAASGTDDPFKLVPIYLHRPEAEVVWERKQKQKE